MANIYQNSYITLAAAAAANDSEGCFMQTQISSKEFKLTASEAYPPIFVRRKLDHWIIPPTEASMQQAPLLTRGWVFQERILSPRVLYFCRRELLWECECVITCECGSESQLASTKLDLDPDFESIKDNIIKRPRGKPSLYRRAVRLMYPHLFPNEQALPEDRYLDESDLDETYSEDETTSTNPATQEDHSLTFENWISTMKFSEKWHRNVERYSTLKLTKPSDYLPALSGLAQLTSSSLKLYAAGLWTDTISADLLWRVDKLQLDSGRPLETRGPSWSWVSVTSRVSYWTLEEAINYTKELISSDSVGTSFNRSGRIHVQHHPQPMPARSLNNISCTTEAKGENRFGEVHAGELSLTGYLQDVTLEYVFDSVYVEGRNWPKMQPNPLRYELRINIPALGELSVPFYADYILSNRAAGQLPDHTQLSLLQIFPGTCLVLKPTGQDSVFERIGVFQAHAAFGT
ncbi:hypothetical protein B0O99DRAFT_592754 [Bisporella sp. PMI_857]|nr:hypothetical protein B0O99DRAFT_592754 [Bisporella sp. PMI_857]